MLAHRFHHRGFALADSLRLPFDRRVYVFDLVFSRLDFDHHLAEVRDLLLKLLYLWFFFLNLLL